MEGFGNQAEADHQEEAEAEHHHGGVAVDKFGERFARPNHHGHRHNHGGHGDLDMLYHGHGGHHSIDGKHGIEHENLQHHTPKRRMLFAVVGVGNGVVVGTLQPFV